MIKKRNGALNQRLANAVICQMVVFDACPWRIKRSELGLWGQECRTTAPRQDSHQAHRPEAWHAAERHQQVCGGRVDRAIVTRVWPTSTRHREAGPSADSGQRRETASCSSTTFSHPEGRGQPGLPDAGDGKGEGVWDDWGWGWGSGMLC